MAWEYPIPWHQWSTHSQKAVQYPQNQLSTHIHPPTHPTPQQLRLGGPHWPLDTKAPSLTEYSLQSEWAMSLEAKAQLVSILMATCQRGSWCVTMVTDEPYLSLVHFDEARVDFCPLGYSTDAPESVWVLSKGASFHLMGWEDKAEGEEEMKGRERGKQAGKQCGYWFQKKQKGIL